MRLDEQVENREAFYSILSALKGMTLKRQRCVVGQMLGLTVPQIAEVIGCSYPAAKKGVLQGKQQVSERIAAC